jgi:hypothetical protein
MDYYVETHKGMPINSRIITHSEIIEGKYEKWWEFFTTKIHFYSVFNTKQEAQEFINQNLKKQ